MCLARAYTESPNRRRKVALSDIAHMTLEGENIHLSTVFGEEKVIAGHLLEVNFETSDVFIVQDE